METSAKGAPERAQEAKARARAASAAAHLLAGSIPEADHALVIVLDERGPSIVGASSERAREIADVLLGIGEEGAPRALLAASRVQEADLVGRPTWPQGAMALREGAGVGGLVGRRLVADGRRLGFIALLSEEPGALLDVDVARLDAVAELLAGWAVAAEHEQTLDQLQTALDSSRTIGRAIGLLMAREALLEREAFARLRALSNETNRSVREVATALLGLHEDDVTAQR